MALALSVDEAFSLTRSNSFGVWNHRPSSEVSTNSSHASRRIYDGFAQVEPPRPNRRFDLRTPVFTMGSCFAREIEAMLSERGGNVVSVDHARMDRPEFRDADGRIRDGFFYRFTPRAMWHEFKIALMKRRAGMPDLPCFFRAGKTMWISTTGP